MRFVLVLAYLSFCYAVEQSTSLSTAQNEHIKDFVEQHIKHVEQQIPLIQQQIKEGKIDVNIEKFNITNKQIPENIKKFVETHISQVLQNVTQQRQSLIPLITSPSIDVPPYVVEKIKKLQEHVKQIMQQVETHIPQVINHQIALKQQLKDKQQNLVTQNVPVKEEQHHMPQVTNQHVEKKVVVGVVPSVVGGIVEKVQQHVPQFVNEHVAQKRDVYDVINHHPSSVKNEVINNPVIPFVVQDIVQQVHQHVPQVLNQVAQIQKRHVQNKSEVPVVSQNVAKNSLNESVVPGHVLGIVQQIHQVSNHKATEVPNKDDHVKPITSSHMQDNAQQIHPHVPQVLNHHVIQDQKKTVIPHSPITHHSNTVTVLESSASDSSGIQSVQTHTPINVANTSSGQIEPSRVQQIQNEKRVVPLRIK